MRVPLLTGALSLLMTGTVFADACTTCTIPPVISVPAGPTTVNNGGNSNNSNSNSSAAPVNTSNTVANPSSQALSSNVNTQVNTVNNANFIIGNGQANCGAPALSVGIADTNQGAYGGGPTGYNSNAITGFIGAVIPLGHSNAANCRAYQQTILAHSYLENCKFFFTNFPGVNPSKIQGFENCMPLYSVVPPAAVAIVPVPVPQVITKEVRVNHFTVYREPNPGCATDVTAIQDLAYVHANRKANLNSAHQSKLFTSTYKRLTQSCTSPERILRAIDG